MAISSPTASIPTPPSSSIYKPLNPSTFEIRLLIISFSVLRNLGQEDPEPLSGRLIHHQLPIGSGSRVKKLYQAVARRNFTALSYVWGNPNHTHEIIIDGVKFPITYSLYSAIRQLQCDFLDGAIPIWVDAICIDQSNNVEKSAQISMMREVYHNAGTVRIWLGPVPTEDEDKIYQVMQWIHALTNGFLPDKYEQGGNEWWEEKYLPLFTKPFGVVGQTAVGGWHKINMFQETFTPMEDDLNPKIKPFETEDEERFSKEFLDWRPRPKDLEAFMKLVPDGDLSIVSKAIERYIIRESEWFTRIWVVQEVGVAWDDIEIVRGPYNQSWGSLLNLIFYLHYTCNVPFPSIDKVTRLEILRLGFKDGKRRRLRELMYECRFRRASDPRDKIYGLHGLMGDKSNLFTKPDYSKSVEEVYAHTTFHFITQARSLDPICGQQRVRKRKGLPSWVPDYELDLELAPEGLLPRDGGEAIFHAAGFDERSEYELHDPEMSFLEWTLLTTRGIRIGVVTHLSEVSGKCDTLSEMQRRWRKTLDDYLSFQAINPEKAQLCSSLDAVAQLVNQYSAYHSPSTSSPSRKPVPIQLTSPLRTTTLEIDTTDPLTLAYLAVLTATRKSPTTRTSAPYIPLLPPLTSSQTQTKTSPAVSKSPYASSSTNQNASLSVTSTSTHPSRSTTSLSSFTIPRKTLSQASNRASTMPNLSSTSSSTSTPTSTSTSISTPSIPVATSISESGSTPASTLAQLPSASNKSKIATRVKSFITSPKTTMATDHMNIPQQDLLKIKEMKESCLVLEEGLRRKRFFVMGFEGEGGGDRMERHDGEDGKLCSGNLGSGVEDMRVGDIVVVLYGCSVPVVLRPVVGEGDEEGWEDVEEEEGDDEVGREVDNGEDDDSMKKTGQREKRREKKNKRAEKERRWELVGEAFVEGFMDAEALAWLVRGRGKVEEFGLV